MYKIKPSRSKKTKPENEQLKIFLQTQLFSVLTYIFLFLLGSFFALIADLPQKYDYIFSLIIFTLSSLSSGFFAGLKLRQNGLIAGVLFSLPMNIIIMLVSAILRDFSVDFNMILTGVILLVSSGAGGILAVNKRLRR